MVEKKKMANLWVEDIVGKSENAGYQHFLLFPPFFSKGFFLRSFNSLPHNPDFQQHPIRRTFEIVRKGENGGNQYFLLFPQSFLCVHELFFNFEPAFILSFANILNLDQSKIMSFGKWQKL